MEYKKDAEIIKVDFECSTCKKTEDSIKKIPVKRVIDKLDAFFDKNDLDGAKNLLEYWQNEAKASNDLSGELSIVNEMLGLYRKNGDKQKAERAIDRAIELLDLTNSTNSMSGATILINAATTSKAVGRPDAAIPMYERAEAIYKACGMQEDDLLFAALYNNFATSLVDIKDYARAKELYLRAIEITKKRAESLLDCAVSFVNLAHLYDEMGEHEMKIEKCLTSAEEIFYDDRIPKDSYYAFVADKCAPSFKYFGYFMLAKELLDKAREIYERA